MLVLYRIIDTSFLFKRPLLPKFEPVPTSDIVRHEHPHITPDPDDHNQLLPTPFTSTNSAQTPPFHRDMFRCILLHTQIFEEFGRRARVETIRYESP